MSRLMFGFLACILAMAGVGEATAQSRNPYTPGARVEVKIGELWYPAVVRKQQGAAYDLHVMGGAGEPFQRATAARLRPAGPAWQANRPVDAQGHAAQATPAQPPPMPAPRPAAGSQQSEQVAVAHPGDKSADRSHAATVDASPRPDFWEAQLQPQPRLPGTTAAATLLKGLTSDIFDHVTALLSAGAESPVVFAVYQNSRPGVQAAQRVERVDIRAGSSWQAFELPPGSVALDTSPSGGRMLLGHGADPFGRMQRLEVVAVSPRGLQPVVAFQPYAGEKGNAIPFLTARFIDDEHLLTTGDDQLTVWHASQAKALWTLSGRGWCTLSPDHRYVFAERGGNLIALDAASGKIGGWINGAAAGASDIAMDPAGTAVAIAAAGAIRVVDLPALTTRQHAALPKQTHSRHVQWLDQDHLLVNGSLLFNIPQGLVTWSYTFELPGRAPTAVAGGKLLYVATGGEGQRSEQRYLVAAPLPHPEVLTAEKAKMQLDAFAIQPGSAVRIEVNLATGEEQAQMVRDGLHKSLEASGLKVQEDAGIVLQAWSGPGESRTREFTRGPGLGRGGSRESVTVPDKVGRLTLSVDGQPLWEVQTVHQAPSMVMIREGQSIHDAVNRSFGDIPPGFFTSTPIPARVPRAAEPQPLGSSRLTRTGPQRTAAAPPPMQ